jgi:hypothetical protein
MVFQDKRLCISHVYVLVQGKNIKIINIGVLAGAKKEPHFSEMQLFNM